MMGCFFCERELEQDRELQSRVQICGTASARELTFDDSAREPSSTRMHARTHSRTHARTYARTHTRTHA